MSANDYPPYHFRITRNRAQCLKCFDIIESKHRNDFVSCKCGAIFIDGGKDYVRSGGDLDAINYLTEYGPYEPRHKTQDVEKPYGDVIPLEVREAA